MALLADIADALVAALAEARGREGWARTSAILALIANVNRDPKKTRPNVQRTRR